MSLFVFESSCESTPLRGGTLPPGKCGDASGWVKGGRPHSLGRHRTDFVAWTMVAGECRSGISSWVGPTVAQGGEHVAHEPMEQRATDRPPNGWFTCHGAVRRSHASQVCHQNGGKLRSRRVSAGKAEFATFPSVPSSRVCGLRLDYAMSSSSWAAGLGRRPLFWPPDGAACVASACGHDGLRTTWRPSAGTASGTASVSSRPCIPAKPLRGPPEEASPAAARKPTPRVKKWNDEPERHRRRLIRRVSPPEPSAWS